MGNVKKKVQDRLTEALIEVKKNLEMMKDHSVSRNYISIVGWSRQAIQLIDEALDQSPKTEEDIEQLALEKLPGDNLTTKTLREVWKDGYRSAQAPAQDERMTKMIEAANIARRALMETNIRMNIVAYERLDAALRQFDEQEA